MKTPAGYLDACKAAFGNSKMSDRELGERLGGYSQQMIAGSRVNKMSDKLALAVATTLCIPAGEVLTVAKLAREKDPEVKAAWADWVGKISGLLPENVAPEAMAAGQEKSPHMAGFGKGAGGDGGFRIPRLFGVLRGAKMWVNRSNPNHRFSTPLAC